jgi:hypothetical protein
MFQGEKPLRTASPFFFFFIGKPAPQSHILGNSIFHDFVTLVYLPSSFGFVYVPTALLILYSICNLAQAGIDEIHDLSALIVTLPVGFIAWLECLL